MCFFEFLNFSNFFLRGVGVGGETKTRYHEKKTMMCVACRTCLKALWKYALCIPIPKPAFSFGVSWWWWWIMERILDRREIFLKL